MGESIFTTPSAQETDPLPIEESLWSQNVSLRSLILTSQATNSPLNRTKTDCPKLGYAHPQHTSRC